MQTSLFDDVPDDQGTGDGPGAPDARPGSCREREASASPGPQRPSPDPSAAGRTAPEAGSRHAGVEGEGAFVDAGEDPSRQTFAVGRLTARQAETELLTPGDSPLPGPWRVKAVVEDRRTAGEAGGEGMGSEAGAHPESPSTPARRLPELLQRLGGGSLVDALRRLLNAVRQ